MYTYNIFVFGHDLSVNPKLNEAVCEFDIEFRDTLNKRKFEVSTPYHGGQVAGDLQSLIFGIVITDDDGNKNFINEVRNAKEEDYLADYQALLAKFIVDLESNKGEEKEYDDLVDKLIKFLNSKKPGFYSVEASS
jgi:hypothetical protein